MKMRELQTGKAIASMVLGIVSVSLSVLSAIVIFFLFVLGILIGAAAMICGIIAIVLGNRARPLGRAMAGFVLGIIGTSLSGSIMVIGYSLYLIF